jgi:DNA-binding NarL/FixJ family response regulator
MQMMAASANAAALRKAATAELVVDRQPFPEAPVDSYRQRFAVRLTPRQREVLSLLCEGLPNKSICRQLNIAAGTVKVHIGVILRELGVASRLQAVVAAQQCGLFDGRLETNAAAKRG